MRVAFLALVLTSTAALAQYAPKFAGTQPLEPALEARVLALGKDIRCVQCQGMSIADSPSSVARAQLDTVRTLVKDGKSDEEIRQYFVERYGEWALLKPDTKKNLGIWAAPFVLFLAGIGYVVWFALSRKPSGSTTTKAAAPAAAGASAPPEDPYLAAVRAELDR